MSWDQWVTALDDEGLGRYQKVGYSMLRGYYKNGQPITSANWGDTITFDVPGHSPSTVFLDQRVNGQRGYFGPFQVPMSPFTLGPSQPQGTWFNYVYSSDPTQPGAALFEQSTLQIGPAPSAPAPKPVSTSPVTSLAPGGDTTQGTSIQVGSTSGSGSATATALAPGGSASGSPVSLPSGTGQGPSSNLTRGLEQLYRFILPMGHTYATGANYPGCSQSNTANCDPQSFADLQAAINYAINRGEIPYRVLSAQEPWDLINGVTSIDPSRIYNADGTTGSAGFGLGTIALLAIGAFLIARR